MSSFNLIASLYNETHLARANEYLHCLERNLTHPLIESVHVLYDRHKDDSDNIILARLRDAGVVIRNIEGRPTYRDCFDYANAMLPGARVILANADIYFNESLALLADASLDNTILALTRWNVHHGGSLKFFRQLEKILPQGHCRLCGQKRLLHHCFAGMRCGPTCSGMVADYEIIPTTFRDQTGYSQDAWIFQTPLKLDFRCDFRLGTFHCDSYLNHHLKNSALDVFNPSLDIQCCHLHLTGVKSADDIELIRNNRQRIAAESKKGNLLAEFAPVTLAECNLQSNDTKFDWNSNEHLIRDSAPPGACSTQGKLPDSEDIQLCQGPIVLYQMGKVGSSSVWDSLYLARVRNALYKVHRLSDETINEAKAFYELRNESMPAHIQAAETLAKILAAGLFRVMHVITLVRDPVGRFISDFFENFVNSKLYLDGQWKLDTNIVTSALLEELQAFDESSDYMVNWFDTELHKVFGIDVFDYDFLPDQGFMIIRRKPVNLLLIRTEDLNRCFTSTIKTFFDTHLDIPLVRRNTSDNKAYANEYKIVLQNIRLPEELLQRIYATRYARHFYSNEEINSLITRWS